MIQTDGNSQFWLSICIGKYRILFISIFYILVCLKKGTIAMEELLEYTSRKDLNAASDQPLVSSSPQSARPPYLKLQKKQSQG